MIKHLDTISIFFSFFLYFFNQTHVWSVVISDRSKTHQRFTHSHSSIINSSKQSYNNLVFSILSLTFYDQFVNCNKISTVYQHSYHLIHHPHPQLTHPFDSQSAVEHSKRQGKVQKHDKLITASEPHITNDDNNHKEEYFTNE